MRKAIVTKSCTGFLPLPPIAKPDCDIRFYPSSNCCCFEFDQTCRTPPSDKCLLKRQLTLLNHIPEGLSTALNTIIM